MPWRDLSVESIKDEEHRVEEEEAQVLDRLDWNLVRVYGATEDGQFDWKKWDIETAADLTARVIVQYPDLWEPFVGKALKSEVASRMLDLMIEELAARARFDRNFGPGWEDLLYGRFDISPRFEGLSWSHPLMDWIVTKPAARELKSGPGRLLWRRVCIAFAVRGIVQVGVRAAVSDDRCSSACTIVAYHLGLSKATVYQGSWRHFRKVERERGELLQPPW